MGPGGEVVTEVAEGVLEGAEPLVVREIDEFVGQAFQEGVGVTTQRREELLAALITSLRSRFGGGRGVVQQENLPGVRSTEAQP